MSKAAVHLSNGGCGRGGPNSLFSDREEDVTCRSCQREIRSRRWREEQERKTPTEKAFDLIEYGWKTGWGDLSSTSISERLKGMLVPAFDNRHPEDFGMHYGAGDFLWMDINTQEYPKGLEAVVGHSYLKEPIYFAAHLGELIEAAPANLSTQVLKAALSAVLHICYQKEYRINLGVGWLSDLSDYCPTRQATTIFPGQPVLELYLELLSGSNSRRGKDITITLGSILGITMMHISNAYRIVHCRERDHAGEIARVVALMDFPPEKLES